jgi:hypothetical protein
MPNPSTPFVPGAIGDGRQITRRIARDADLDRLATLAETAADKLHDVIADVQNLRDALLTNIEDVGGDREYNWALQADIGYALTAIYSASYKARTVARHAKAGKDAPVAP